MTLCAKMINFVGFNIINNTCYLFGIAKIPIVKEKFYPEVVRINQSRQQDYLENQRKKTKLVLRAGGQDV